MCSAFPTTAYGQSIKRHWVLCTHPGWADSCPPYLLVILLVSLSAPCSFPIYHRLLSWIKSPDMLLQMKLLLLLLLLLSLYKPPKPAHFQKCDFVKWGFFKTHLFYFPSPNFRKILYAAHEASMAWGCACGQPEPQHRFQGNIAPYSPAENCYFYWHLCCSRIWKRAWRSFMAWSACSCCHWWKKKEINFKTAGSVLCITMGKWCSGLLPYLKCHCTSERKSQGSKMKKKKYGFFSIFFPKCM